MICVQFESVDALFASMRTWWVAGHCGGETCKSCVFSYLVCWPQEEVPGLVAVSHKVPIHGIAASPLGVLELSVRGGRSARVWRSKLPVAYDNGKAFDLGDGRAAAALSCRGVGHEPKGACAGAGAHWPGRLFS